MPTFSSPERPREYGQDPLHRAQGGVRLGREDMERTKDLVREFSTYSPEVKEKVVTSIQRIREECGEDRELFEKTITGITALLQEITSRLPDRWTYEDLLRELDKELAEIEISLEVKKRGGPPSSDAEPKAAS